MDESAMFANRCNDMTLYHRTFVLERCRYNNSKTLARHAVTLKFETRNVSANRKKAARTTIREKSIEYPTTADRGVTAPIASQLLGL